MNDLLNSAAAHSPGKTEREGERIGIIINDDLLIFLPSIVPLKSRKEIEVQEDVAKAFLFDAGVSLSELVDAINAVGATPSDLVAILEALREAGALNAELIVI